MRMHSKKEAIAIYQAVGLQLMSVHEEDLRAQAEQTGKIYLPNTDSSVAKRLHRHVRKSRSVDDAIEPAMEAEAAELRGSVHEPLRSVMLYRQALSTLMELATSKYGDREEVEVIGRRLDQRMPELLRLDY